MNFAKVEFLISAFSLKQLPPPHLPEFAFAGRSNVGKSSLMNCLLQRRNFVKTSSKPGKTQSLNYFLVDQQLHLVDLPGYGFARVSKKAQDSWQEMITDYLSHRPCLCCVVVLIDIRHELKATDRELVDWLRFHQLNFVLVYTKADKLTANKRQRQTAALDAALGIDQQQRILFSAKTGQGRTELLQHLTEEKTQFTVPPA